MKVDLHIHSDFSDGKYSPSRVVEYATHNRLDIISLTDHDTIDGVHEAIETAQKLRSVTVIPGVEFSTWLEEHELHILGYGIDVSHAGLLDLLKVAKRNRRIRIERILAELRANNVRLVEQDVRNGFRAACLGRLHVAHALLDRGYVYTIREAFDRYLSYKTGVIELFDTDFVPAHLAVEAILAAGGLPVLAHPTIEIFDRYVDVLMEYGLRGVEVFKGMRPSIDEFYFETVGNDKGLLLTGGSDWHGYHGGRKLGRFYVDSGRVQPFLQAMCVS